MLTAAERTALNQRLRRGRAPAAAPIPRRPAQAADLPLSHGQQQLWFIDQLAPGQPAYNIPLAIRLTGPLDREALGRALDGLAARHESLRTRLAPGQDGDPVQVVDPPVACPLPRTDLSGLDPRRQRASLGDFIRARSLRPFDLAAGPLLRADLVRTGRREHVLVIVVHHSVFDGWSAAVLLRDLAALYVSSSTGEPAALPDLPVQFADYALWERGRLTGQALATLAGYWRDTLAGAETVHFPADRPHPVLEDFGGGLATRMTGPGLLAQVRDLGRAHGATVFGTLLAALFALLHRYTGQGDLTVGTVTASRTRAELAPLIGFLVNTLPIRADLSGDPAFTDLLTQVKQVTATAYAHQDLPFSAIVDTVGAERDPGRSPLFQIAFAYAERDPAAVTAAGVEFELTDLIVGIESAKFDLDFTAEARPDGLWIECSYKTALFDAETIERLLGHFEMLLHGIVAKPAARLSWLPLLTEAELHRELVTWNDTAEPVPAACAHWHFEAQVRRAPSAVAAEHGADEISYAGLDRLASRIARMLRAAGVGPETLVGVCLPPGFRLLATLLGVWKAGGGYVPLDPGLPAARLAFMIADAAMPVIVADDSTLAALPVTEAMVLCLPALVPDSPPQHVSGPEHPAEPSPANVAYVIYTSGSTGRPKGVVIEHRHLVNCLLGYIRRWQITQADAVLQVASVSFDASVQEMFMPLLAGARVVLTPAVTAQSPRRLAGLIRERRVTFALLTPSVAGLLADQTFPDLRVLSCGGEELPSALVPAWLRPGLTFVNEYGPTETTISATVLEVDQATPLPPPIGRPNRPNYRAYVLDRQLNPVPVGVAGELHIGGDSVGRGYLNRPELTGQRFIPDPWHRGAGPPGQRLYKSGDLVRRNADGTISFAGRVDDQVKIRGLRIELGEIETALTTHPSVAQALVTVAIDPAGDKELAGYYRLTTGPAGPADGDLRAHLSRTLPGYMIPARLIEVDAFPLTSNGKIDKAALPKPSTAGGHGTADEEHTSPATALEAAIGRLFAQVLKRGDVGITDNFFRVGGNSLQVMRLIDLVYRETGAELGAAAVFLHPSPRALAAAIESVRTGTTTGSANAGSLIRLTSGPGGLPLIVIHAVGGTVFAYTPLAAELAGTFQVHGLEAPVLRSAAATYETIADLADDYARRIRSAQPDGPYRLAGWSMGGILAFEITRRLETAGAVVGLLALLDAPYAIPAEGAPTTAQLTALFLVDAARSLGWDLTGLPDPASPPDGQLAWLAGRLGEDPDDDGGTGTEAITTQLTRRLDAFGTHQRLLASYQPAGPAVRAPTLIVSAARSPNALTRKLWPSVLGGQVSVLDVDGDHYEFLRPPMVADVATAILSWHGSLR